MTDKNLEMTPNQVVSFLKKKQEDFTKEDIIGFIRANGIRMVNFMYPAEDGRVKTLLLHGGSGLGKTFLLGCVEAAVREKGVDTLYTTAYDLLNELKNEKTYR